MTEQEEYFDKNKYLTWHDLADFYKKKTGQSSRIRPMHMIYKWAVKQKEIVEDENGLRFVGGKNEQ
jgi:hypothetical protein